MTIPHPGPIGTTYLTPPVYNCTVYNLWLQIHLAHIISPTVEVEQEVGRRGGGLVRFSDLLVSTSMEKPRRPKLTHGPEQALDIGASGPRVSVRLGSKLTCRYVSMGIPSEAGSGGRWGGGQPPTPLKCRISRNDTFFSIGVG